MSSYTEIFLIYKWDTKEYLVGEQDISSQKILIVGGFKSLRKALKIMKYIQKHGSGCKVPRKMIFSRKEMKKEKLALQDYNRLRGVKQ